MILRENIDQIPGLMLEEKQCQVIKGNRRMPPRTKETMHNLRIKLLQKRMAKKEKDQILQNTTEPVKIENSSPTTDEKLHSPKAKFKEQDQKIEKQSNKK